MNRKKDLKQKQSEEILQITQSENIQGIDIEHNRLIKLLSKIENEFTTNFFLSTIFDTMIYYYFIQAIFIIIYANVPDNNIKDDSQLDYENLIEYPPSYLLLFTLFLINTLALLTNNYLFETLYIKKISELFDKNFEKLIEQEKEIINKFEKRDQSLLRFDLSAFGTAIKNFMIGACYPISYSRYHNDIPQLMVFPTTIPILINFLFLIFYKTKTSKFSYTQKSENVLKALKTISDRLKFHNHSLPFFFYARVFKSSDKENFISNSVFLKLLTYSMPTTLKNKTRIFKDKIFFKNWYANKKQIDYIKRNLDKISNQYINNKANIFKSNQLAHSLNACINNSIIIVHNQNTEHSKPEIQQSLQFKTNLDIKWYSIVFSDNDYKSIINANFIGVYSSVLDAFSLDFKNNIIIFLQKLLNLASDDIYFKHNSIMINVAKLNAEELKFLEARAKTIEKITYYQQNQIADTSVTPSPVKEKNNNLSSEKHVERKSILEEYYQTRFGNYLPHLFQLSQNKFIGPEIAPSKSTVSFFLNDYPYEMCLAFLNQFIQNLKDHEEQKKNDIHQFNLPNSILYPFFYQKRHRGYVFIHEEEIKKFSDKGEKCAKMFMDNCVLIENIHYVKPSSKDRNHGEYKFRYPDPKNSAGRLFFLQVNKKTNNKPEYKFNYIPGKTN